MEEVDSILISQLREIGCQLDDDIQRISSLDSYQIMHCVANCLLRFVNDQNLIELIPDVRLITSSMNMSIKYKLANQLSNCIQNIGYKSDIGYQTFLYSNEHEIRRLLLFLIEQISTDGDEKVLHDGQSPTWFIGKGNVLQKLKNIKLNTVWIPYSSFYEDTDDEDDLKYSPESDYYDSFETNTNQNTIYGLLNLGFSIQSVLSSSQQSSPSAKLFKYKLSRNYNNLEMIPSKFIDILEWNNHFWKDNHSDDGIVQNQFEKDFLNSYLTICETKQINPITYRNDYYTAKNIPLFNSDIKNISHSLKSEFCSSNMSKSGSQNSLEDELLETSLKKLRRDLQECEEQISKLRNDGNELFQYEQEYQEKCKLFEASYKSKEELENSIAAMKSSIEEISSTWEEMQKELLEKLKMKKIENMAQNEEHVEKVKMINTLKKSITLKVKEIQTKELLIEELESKIPQQWPPGRGSYTRRIIEIIQNVKKQNDETKKVVLETKTVQKDINNLNGKIERSFAVAQEVLFKEAKQNEWNRKCYNSLALLQSTFTELLQAITDIGIYLREIRKLEEMIESENNQKTSSNLIRINADLEQIRLENKQLRQKLQDETTN